MKNMYNVKINSISMGSFTEEGMKAFIYPKYPKESIETDFDSIYTDDYGVRWEDVYIFE